MDSETIVVDFMPIRITHHDKKGASMQHADISRVMTDLKIASLASYTDRKQAFRMLCGSIYTLDAPTLAAFGRSLIGASGRMSTTLMAARELC